MREMSVCILLNIKSSEDLISFILFLIVEAILILFIIFCFINFKISLKAKKAYKEEIQKRGITIHTALLHKFGLPILENSKCEVFSYADKIEFKSGTTIVTLARDKITDMAIKTYSQVQHQLVSSAGDAIAGAMAFGSIGASIGGRIRNE